MTYTMSWSQTTRCIRCKALVDLILNYMWIIRFKRCQQFWIYRTTTKGTNTTINIKVSHTTAAIVTHFGLRCDNYNNDCLKRLYYNFLNELDKNCQTSVCGRLPTREQSQKKVSKQVSQKIRRSERSQTSKQICLYSHKSSWITLHKRFIGHDG